MKKPARCAAHGPHPHLHSIDRRQFLLASASALAVQPFLGGRNLMAAVAGNEDRVQPCGPGAACVPVIHAAFVRRKGEYGMRWPGAAYDGRSAEREYRAKTQETADRLRAKLVLRPAPIHSDAEAEAWVAEARQTHADGLLVILLDRQEHSWPTAHRAADSGIPCIVFSPLGSSFTTNTVHLAERPGCVIYSTVGEFDQAAYGMKMIVARTRMKRARCVVLHGNQRKTGTLPDFGTELRYLPAHSFLDDYEAMGTPAEVVTMAESYLRRARSCRGATRQDVVNGIKSYCVARDMLRREQADAITMDCLGALGDSTVSLPCIAWSRLNDEGVPAACEADLGAVASHLLVQYLFDRPGFQQDPVADTSQDAVIGAHCSCPTRLHGFDQPPEPFDLVHHHGNRDAVPRTLWQPRQRVTSLDVLLGDGNQRPTELLVSVGKVIDNLDVPPAGGCVVSVRVKFDGNHNVLAFPGFHQLFFYGDFGRPLLNFAQLCGFKGTKV
ncbi:MAG: hypothetical protein KJ072_24365 [Verrucomicrobia bacterium]|nr:hypothetical protein [Verrucomicrobiota bacterium]